MKISAEFVISAASTAQVPVDELPQIALCGRSNVGKSSLINALVNRKNLARTSNTPGKTRQLNFYRVSLSTEIQERSFYFVDLPGYGYARVSQNERESWRQLIEQYFQQARSLRAVFSIIDGRLGPQRNDLELLDWLATLQVPIIVVATKADKLKNNQRNGLQHKTAAAVAHLPVAELLMFSAVSKLGRKELWQIITKTLFD